MEPSNKREYRSFDVELREKDGAGVIEGYAAVFNLRARIGNYEEVVLPGAFTESIKSDDIFSFFNHDTNLVLARTKNGSLQLSEDAHGLKIRMVPADTPTAQEARKLIKEGFVDRMSFGFNIVKQTWKKGENGAPDVREIQQVRLWEVSPVPFPAYAGTEVVARNQEVVNEEGCKGNDATEGVQPPVAPTDLGSATKPASIKRHAYTGLANTNIAPKGDTKMKLQLQQMIDKRAAIVEAQRKLWEAAGDKALSAEDQEKLDRMQADYVALDKTIQAGLDIAQREDAERLANQSRAADRTTANAAPAAPEKNDRIRAFEDYIVRGIVSPELRASTDPQNVGTPADGGYAVPNEWYQGIMEVRKARNIMRQLATVVTSNSGTFRVPKESTNGVAAWYQESDSIVVAQEQLSYCDFTAWKVGRIIKATAELLRDMTTTDAAAYFMRKLAESMGITEETAFVAGNNTYQPNGIFSAATTGVTAAASTAFTADELINLFHSVTAPYRDSPSAAWLMSDATALLVRKLKDGNQQYLWQTGLQGGQPTLLLGKPVYTTSYAPAATAGLDAVLFGDLKGYWIVDRAGVNIKMLYELYAVNDQVGMLGTARTDGDLVDTNAVRVLTMKA